MAEGKPWISVEQQIDLCKDYTRQWSDFFKIFADGLENKKITPNEERIFNQMLTILALKHFRFAEMMGENLPNPEGILEVLCDAVSLQQMKDLSEAQFSKLQVDWHTEFIAMNKCLGKLLSMLPIERRNEIHPTTAFPHAESHAGQAQEGDGQGA